MTINPKQIRVFALVLGLVYLVIGIVGFFPGLLTEPAVNAPRVTAESGFGLLFGLFPVNALHNLVHIGFGLWGIAAWRGVDSARTFARTFAIVFAVLTVMGLLPVLRTTFGLIPLYGHDVWLHALSALAAAYYGFAASERLTTTGGAPMRH